jgi:hypothetical protein
MELSQMLARRDSLAGPFGPPPLILAVVIHDTEEVDTALADIQRFNLRDYSNPWIAEGSPMAELLSRELERFSRDVAAAISQVPAYNPTWETLATGEFMKLFRSAASQRHLPSLGADRS